MPRLAGALKVTKIMFTSSHSFAALQPNGTGGASSAPPASLPCVQGGVRYEGFPLGSYGEVASVQGCQVGQG